MKITIHRGTHEIGGSCVEISSQNSRIVVDIGLPLNIPDGQSFEISNDGSRTGVDLVKDGLLPDIAGIYKWDTAASPIDGLLISHAHMDHYGLIPYLRSDICCYMGEATRRLVDLTAMFTPFAGHSGSYRAIKSGSVFTCGNFRITPYLMDHSAFDAYAFLIEAEGKKVLYSGDFREHGRKAKAFYWFLHQVPEHIDAVLLEGTMFGRQEEQIVSEDDIGNKIVKAIGNNDRIALLYFSSQNIDRLVSFYKASLKLNRLFVIDFYTANILAALKDFGQIPYPSPNYQNIRVFFPSRLANRIQPQDKELLMYRFVPYKIKKEEISSNPAKIMMMVRPSMMNDLMRMGGLEEAVFIYSMWEGYWNQIGMEKMRHFIELNNMQIHKIHTSGHGYISTLKKVINKVKPAVIIPIHTFHPDAYRSLWDNVCTINDGETIEI